MLTLPLSSSLANGGQRREIGRLNDWIGDCCEGFALEADNLSGWLVQEDRYGSVGLKFTKSNKWGVRDTQPSFLLEESRATNSIRQEINRRIQATNRRIRVANRWAKIKNHRIQSVCVWTTSFVMKTLICISFIRPQMSPVVFNSCRNIGRRRSEFVRITNLRRNLKEDSWELQGLLW